jgi:hypothetical protein
MSVRVGKQRVDDSEGTEITVGSEVAFNYSGEVHRGKVTSVKVLPARAYDYLQRPRALIRVAHKGGESKVNSGRNMLVLKQGSDA